MDGPTLLEFKAGKLNMSGTTVTPDPRKGLVIVRNMDGMTAMVWKDRTSGKEDAPIILFPDDAVFRKCKSCPSGRVFYLKFSNDRRDFFWMQEHSSANDDEYARKLNDIIKGEQESGDAEMHDAVAAADTASQPLLRQMFGLDGAGAGAGTSVSATPVAAAAASSPPAAPVRVPPELMDERSRALVAALASQVAAIQGPDVNLAHVLAPENIEPILSDPAVIAELVALLPPGPSSAAHVLDNIRSPQYAQALASFSAALATGQLDDVMRQFGVDPAVARVAGGGAKGLCGAIEELVKKERGEGGGDSSA